MPEILPPAVRILLGGSSHASTPDFARAERSGLDALRNIACGLDSYLSDLEATLLDTKSDQFTFPGPL